MTGPALTREECQRLAGLVRLGLKAGLFGVQYEDFLEIADLVEAYPIVVEPSSAIGPTREELGPLVENARSVEEGDRLTERTIALLDAYPLPPGDGEREDLSNRALRHATAIQVAHGPTARVLRECAAALLRQPPRGGVSKEAVKAAIRKALFHQASGPVATLLDTARENCLEAVEALPEPEPPPPAAGVSKADAVALIKAAFRHLAFLPEHPARWQIRQAGENLVKAIEALPEAAAREAPEEVAAAFDAWYLRTYGVRPGEEGSGDIGREFDRARREAYLAGWNEKPTTAPPSGVDREEIDRLRFLLTQAVDFLRGGGTLAARKRWADAVERDLALPEAKSANGWHYLPELPEEGREVLLRLAADADPAAMQEWVIADIRRGIGAWFIGVEPLAERQRWGWRPIAWRYLPEPPPLPEVKP